MMNLYHLLAITILLNCNSYWSFEQKDNISLDDFFNYTQFISLSFSPCGQYLLYQTSRSVWNLDTYENSLWLYEIQTKSRKCLDKQYGQIFDPHWSSNGKWISYLFNEKNIHFYSISHDKLFPIELNLSNPSMLTWSQNDTSLFLISTITNVTNEKYVSYRNNIKKYQSVVYRIDVNIDIDNNQSSITNIHNLQTVSFLIGEFLYAPLYEKFILTSTSTIYENIDEFEIYSIDIKNKFQLKRLTNNHEFEIQLALSNDGKHIFYRTYTRRSNQPEFNDTQRRLYSFDLTTNRIERFGKDFNGNIPNYKILVNEHVYILGQYRTEVQIYIQNSSNGALVHKQGWNGTYEQISLSNNRPKSLAFIYSSFHQPKEIYFAEDIDQLHLAYPITNENQYFLNRNLPEADVYQWINSYDNETIEGILYYPPGKYHMKDLPLFILIHGGPYDADLNSFEADWYNWARLAASYGWLVLQPNYCGSSGYGDKFLNEIRGQPLTRPGRDILSAVDQLIQDGIADQHKLTIGGYSYGGFLTNWLITQTSRFNAALSGSGSIEHTLSWGVMDLPILFEHLFTNYPWNIADIYHEQSPIYQLHKVNTPTHIVTGEKDIRVHPTQSYILERALHNLGVPVKLIVFPKEGHGLSGNPWYGKIKVREELKWLQTYGHQSNLYFLK